jgi:AraC-like DNA-binding protein
METKLKPHQLCCRFGILQVAVPVVILGRHVATILGGKVRLDPSCIQQRSGLVRQLRRCGLTGDLRSLQKAYLAVPVLPRARVRVALGLLDHLAQLFARALSQETMPASFTPPSLAFQTSQFIRQHLGEHLTTRQTAAACHLSEAYFCRRFHRLTGMTFHAYLTQLRVERAKAALRATNARVNEIALALGFQSASHFNRAFKFIVGMTPSAFRGQRRQRRQRR